MQRKRVALSTLICGWSVLAAVRGGAVAQEVPSRVPPSAARTGRTGMPEQVTVTADRDKLSRLIIELQETEEDFYEEFNKLNVNPEYETHCERKRRHEPQLLEEVCVPKFVATASELETPDKMADYKRKIYELARQDAKLGRIANDYAALNMQIEAVRNEKQQGGG